MSGKTSFAQLLRAIRNERGLTIQSLCDRTGVSASYLASLESKSEPNPSAEVIKKIVDGLGLDSVERSLIYSAFERQPEDFIPLIDYPIEKSLALQASKLAKEVWVVMPEPLELSEAGARQVASNIKSNDTRYVYFLNHPLKARALRESLEAELGFDRLNSRVECITASDPYLFRPPFLLVQTENSRGVIGLWVKQLDTAYYRVFEMDPPTAQSIFYDLRMALQACRRDGRIELPEYSHYSYEFPIERRPR